MVFETILNKGVEPVRWLLVAGIAFTLANSIWSFFETPVTATIDTPKPVQQSQAQRSPANINWILGKHLFGEAGAAPIVANNNDEPAVQTRLPLELQSVFVADDPDQSAAIVAQRGKPGQLYHVGDNVPGNAKLVDVHKDKIILRRAGARETLMFPQSKSKFVAQATEDDELEELGDDPPPFNQSQLNNNLADDISGDDVAVADEAGDLIETYRDRLAEDATGTLNELGIEVVDDAGAGGYRIGDTSQSAYLRQTGLQAGDVILSVNGRPVGDIQQDQLELQNIMAQGSARIEVQRGSRRFFITASLN